MKQIPGQAVVLGAGMAGLLAARVLADAYQRVTVVERDPLPQRPANRKGVPQGRHAPICWCHEGRKSSTSCFRVCSATSRRGAHR